MSYEHKKACERIASLCSKASQTTKRMEQIYDIALTALGRTANQREYEIRMVRENAIQKTRDRASKLVS